MRKAIAALVLLALHCSPATAQEPDPRLFAAHVLDFRAGGVSGAAQVAEALANVPGAAAFAENGTSLLWRPFFENTIVKLGRVRTPQPVALYYNPLLDAALLAFWERDEDGYHVASIRALPGERLAGPAAPPAPPFWKTPEESPFAVLSHRTQARLDAFETEHPAAETAPGPGRRSFADAAADMRAVAPRLVWKAVHRASWEDAAHWLEPALASVRDLLAKADAAAVAQEAPDTNRETAVALAGLPSAYVESLVLDMVLGGTGPERILVGSSPDDGDIYVLLSCKLERDSCAPRRFVLLFLLD